YLFSCSDAAGKWLYGETATKKRNYYIMKNAIDINKYRYNENMRRKVRETLNIKNNFVVGHVGRLTKAKNHVYIIEIFNSILKKQENAILLLVGDGELREKLEHTIQEYGLQENVIFTGTRENISD